MVVLAGFLFTGCAPLTYRANNEFKSYFVQKKKVLVLSPNMKIFQLTAGGVDQYKDDWSVGSKNFMAAELKAELESFNTIDFVQLDNNVLSESNRRFIEQQNGIFYIVAHSVVTHTYESPTFFKHKIENFDYTLGEELSAFKDIVDAEAILFIDGRNYIWTAGRASLAFLSGAVGLFTGVYVPVPAGKEWLTASLVDIKTGDLLWFNYLAMPGDMRMEKTVRRLSKKLFRDFPKEWRDEGKWEIRKEEGHENND